MSASPDRAGEVPVAGSSHGVKLQVPPSVGGRTPGAKSAFQKLIDDNVESWAIEYWLGTIGTSPDERPKASRDRRKTARLIRQATSLAQAIDRA